MFDRPVVLTLLLCCFFVRQGLSDENSIEKYASALKEAQRQLNDGELAAAQATLAGTAEQHVVAAAGRSNFESLVFEVGDELVASDWFVFDDQDVVLLFCHGSLSCWNASKLLI